MEPGLVLDVISKLGVAGFAIWIMYRMSIKFIDWIKEKDELHHKSMNEINGRLLDVIGKNTEAINENTKAFQRVMSHIDR